jgi:hypothetical protein
MKKFKPKIIIKYAEIETNKSSEEWEHDFIMWLESRGEQIYSVLEIRTVPNKDAEKKHY